MVTNLVVELQMDGGRPCPPLVLFKDLSVRDELRVNESQQTMYVVVALPVVAVETGN